MVSWYEAGISNTIHLEFLLGHTLYNVIAWALEAQQLEEEEYFLLFQGQYDPLITDSIPVRQRKNQGEGEYGEIWVAGQE